MALNFESLTTESKFSGIYHRVASMWHPNKSTLFLEFLLLCAIMQSIGQKCIFTTPRFASFKCAVHSSSDSISVWLLNNYHFHKCSAFTLKLDRYQFFKVQWKRNHGILKCTLLNSVIDSLLFNWNFVKKRKGLVIVLVS